MSIHTYRRTHAPRLSQTFFCLSFFLSRWFRVSYPSGVSVFRTPSSSLKVDLFCEQTILQYYTNHVGTIFLPRSKRCQANTRVLQHSSRDPKLTTPHLLPSLPPLCVLRAGIRIPPTSGLSAMGPARNISAVDRCRGRHRRLRRTCST